MLQHDLLCGLDSQFADIFPCRDRVRGHTYTGHESAVQCLVRVDGDAQGSVVPAKNDASSEIARLAWPDSIVSGSSSLLVNLLRLV